MEELNSIMHHQLYLEERNKLKITGVTDIGIFNDESISVSTVQGDIIVRGENLHITKIDVDSGELLAEGNFYDVSYLEQQNKNESFFAKLFR